MALVKASYHDDASLESHDFLRWLESLPPPSMAVCKEVRMRPNVASYVPVTNFQGKNPTLKKKYAKKKIDKKKDKDGGGESEPKKKEPKMEVVAIPLFPTDKQTFPAAEPVNKTVYFIWQEDTSQSQLQIKDFLGYMINEL